MIGILEIVFTFIISCLIWFVVFKVMRNLEGKKLMNNIITGIEKQDKKFFTDGKEVDLKKELGLLKDKQETGAAAVEEETPSPGIKPSENLEVPVPSEEEVAHSEKGSTSALQVESEGSIPSGSIQPKEEKTKSKVMSDLFKKNLSLKKKLLKHKDLGLEEHKELIIEENKSPTSQEKEEQKPGLKSPKEKDADSSINEKEKEE